MNSNLYRALINGAPVPVKFTRTASATAANGISISKSGGDPSQCFIDCMHLSFKMAALSDNQCFCLEGGDIQLTDEVLSGDDVLSVFDFSKYLPKPDGSNMMSDEQIPGTSYVRFLMGNELQPCGFTKTAVDPTKGPAGTWTSIGEHTTIINCISQCAMKWMNFGAVLPEAEDKMKCWCAKSADMSSLDKNIPKTAGRAQIYDFTKAINRMMSG